MIGETRQPSTRKRISADDPDQCRHMMSLTVRVVGELGGGAPKGEARPPASSPEATGKMSIRDGTIRPHKWSHYYFNNILYKYDITKYSVNIDHYC
jgi:hypothetical protein